MAVGAKFLILGASLVGASCGGYVIYKNVSSFDSEKTQDKAASVSIPEGSESGGSPASQPSSEASSSQTTESSSRGDSTR